MERSLFEPDTMPPSPSLSDSNTLSWYVVPDTVKQLLALTSTHWNQPEIADGYMQQALAIAGHYPDVLVSAYRYFFYTQNNVSALQVASRVLDMVKREEALPDDWTTLKSILLDRRDHPNIRLFINAYAASGLIRARLGDLETAKKIANQVSEVEYRNEFGGNVVKNILEYPDDED